MWIEVLKDDGMPLLINLAMSNHIGVRVSDFSIVCEMISTTDTEKDNGIAAYYTLYTAKGDDIRKKMATVLEEYRKLKEALKNVYSVSED
jgi:mevalonate pyrophosphate decarboxylase